MHNPVLATLSELAFMHAKKLTTVLGEYERQFHERRVVELGQATESILMTEHESLHGQEQSAGQD